MLCKNFEVIPIKLVFNDLSTHEVVGHVILNSKIMLFRQNGRTTQTIERNCQKMSNP